VPEVVEVSSGQEEADTRLLLHAKHAATPHVKAVIISSDDTDVRISFAHAIPVPIYQRCISQLQARYVDISKIAGVLGQEVSKAHLGLHAFTGCDTVSAFAGIGKAGPLKLLRSKNEFQVIFQNLGEQWSLTEELCVQLESFVRAMYGMKKGNQDVNQWRYAVFCSKKGEAESHYYHLVTTAYTITAREPITKLQSGRMHSPITKFQVRLATDGL